MPTFDVNMFPIDDLHEGLAFPGENPETDEYGVRLDYDLRKRLPAVLRTNRAFYDAFGALSRSMFENVDKHRRAMMDCRDPGILASPFNHMHARMLGFDYRSAVLTDEIIERISDSYSLFRKANKHSLSFVQYIGWIMDIAAQAYPLWTKDYKSFSVNHGETVFEGGEWFPTSHVGVVFSPNSFDMSAVPSKEEISNLFYRLAPANLVLGWVGTLFTGAAEMPIMGGFAQMSIRQRGAAGIRHGVSLSTAVANRLTIRQRSVVAEMHPTASYGIEVGGTDVMRDSVVCQPIGTVDWSSGEMVAGMTFLRSTSVTSFDARGLLVWCGPNIPRTDYCDPTTKARKGWLIEPERYGYVRSAFDITSSPWGIVPSSSGGARTVAGSLTNPEGASASLFSGGIFAQTLPLAPSAFSSYVLNTILHGNGDWHYRLSWLRANGSEISHTDVLMNGADAVGGNHAEGKALSNGWYWTWTSLTPPDGADSVTITVTPPTQYAVYWIQLQSGSVGYLPFESDGCNVTFCAADRLYVTGYVKSIFKENNGVGRGTILVRATPFDSGEMGVLYMGNAIPSLPTQEIGVWMDGAGHNCVKVSTTAVDTVTQDGFTDTKVGTVARFGYTFENTSIDYLIGSVGTSTILKTPAVDHVIIGTCAGHPSFHGVLEHLTIVPMPVESAYIPNLI